MALKKICPRCNKIIDYSKKYCDECSKDTNKKTNKRYKDNRIDIKESSFYKTKEWVGLRSIVLVHYKGLDIYEYYINHCIVDANIVHHVVELKDKWNRRLDVTNMITCSKATHNYIHSVYRKSDKDKKNMQMILKGLMIRWDNEFNI